MDQYITIDCNIVNKPIFFTGIYSQDKTKELCILKKYTYNYLATWRIIAQNQNGPEILLRKTSDGFMFENKHINLNTCRKSLYEKV